MWSIIERIKPVYYNCVWLNYSCCIDLSHEICDELETIQHKLEELIVNITFKDFNHPDILNIMSEIVANDIWEPEFTERKQYDEEEFKLIEKRINEIGAKALTTLKPYVPFSEDNSEIFNDAPIVKDIPKDKRICSWNVFYFSIVNELEDKDKWIAHCIRDVIYSLFVNFGYYLDNGCKTLDNILRIYDSRNNLDDVVEYLRHL